MLRRHTHLSVMSDGCDIHIRSSYPPGHVDRPIPEVAADGGPDEVVCAVKALQASELSAGFWVEVFA